MDFFAYAPVVSVFVVDTAHGPGVAMDGDGYGEVGGGLTVIEDGGYTGFILDKW